MPNKILKGAIIKESLANTSVLKNVNITKTDILPVTKRHQTPWIKQWTFHFVEVKKNDAEFVAKKISKNIDPKHNAWYADFKNDKLHYIIYRNKIFKINRSKKNEYEKALEYGRQLGIPKYQLDFSPYHKSIMPNQKILILGSTGFLGSKISEMAPKNFEIWLAYRNKPLKNKFKTIELDLFNFVSLKEKITKIKPQIIIHAARMHPYDDKPEKAQVATSQLVQIIKSIDAKLLYISSSAVFDGKKGNYKEADKPNPITPYGTAKFMAENIFKNLDNFIIIRPGYIYGKATGKMDKRTAKLLNEIKQKQTVHRFMDVYRSPILVDDLAQACWKLININFCGIIHIAGMRKTIFQFNQEIAESLGYDPKIIKPNSFKNSNLKIAADVSLNMDLARRVIGFKTKSI